MLSSKKYISEKWLVVLIPFSTIFSIFFLELSFVVLTSSFFYRIIVDRNFQYFKNKFFLLFIFFYSYILIRFFFVETEYLKQTASIIFYFRFGFYALALYYFLEKIEGLENLFIKAVLYAFFILIIDGTIQFTLGTNLLGNEIFDNNRVSSFFGDELILGSYLLRFLPFIYLFLIKNLDNKINYSIAIILIITTNIMIFLSGERSSTLLMLFITFYFLIGLKKLKIFRLIFVFFISTSIIFLLLFNSTNLKTRVIDKTINELTISQDKIQNEIFPGNKTKFNFYFISATHTNYFYTSINIFKDNMFFGKGPKTYRYYCNDERFKINRWSCSTHPHNFYVQLLAELGIVGFFYIFFIYAYLFFKSIKLLFINNENNYYSICIMSFFLINLWPITSTGNFFNNWLSIVMYIPIGFYLSKISK